MQTKSGREKLLRRLTPEVRDDFLREEKETNMKDHIRKTDDGKFKVDLSNTTHNTYAEAEAVVGKFFEEE